MKPVIHAPYFAFTAGVAPWKRMADVLRMTAQRHCPEWDIRVDEINALADYVKLNKSANAMKLASWTERACAEPDGRRVLLMDSDMIVNHPIDDIWNEDFDIAFTHRPGRAERNVKIPMNGGVVFFRVSEPVRHFFREWQRISGLMVKDYNFHSKWRRLYGGQNQAALGAILGGSSDALTRLKVRWLDCREWNACDPEWQDCWRSARILHLKSALRRDIFSGVGVRSQLGPIVKHWRSLESG